jgi:endoglucanase Acf2
MPKASTKRARSSTVERPAHNRRAAGSTPAGPTSKLPPITRVDFYGSLKVPEKTHENWWCPFCVADVTMKQKAHLMICTGCGNRID